jgi:hypothetical protein
MGVFWCLRGGGVFTQSPGDTEGWNSWRVNVLSSTLLSDSGFWQMHTVVCQALEHLSFQQVLHPFAVHPLLPLQSLATTAQGPVPVICLSRMLCQWTCSTHSIWAWLLSLFCLLQVPVVCWILLLSVSQVNACPQVTYLLSSTWTSGLFLVGTMTEHTCAGLYVVIPMPRKAWWAIWAVWV